MELLTTKLLHCFCLDSLRNTHVLFDESDSLGDAAADNVFRPLPLECPEAGDGAEHGAARVRDELLAHRLRPPVHVIYGVLECATPGDNNNT